MNGTDVVAKRALQAWQLCADSAHWPKMIDTIGIATWHGAAIAWPLYEGECFCICRIADSTVVDEAELPSDEAHALVWTWHELRPVAVWTAEVAA